MRLLKMCFYSNQGYKNWLTQKNNAPLIRDNCHIQGAYRNSFLPSSKKEELKIEYNSKEDMVVCQTHKNMDWISQQQQQKHNGHFSQHWNILQSEEKHAQKKFELSKLLQSIKIFVQDDYFISINLIVSLFKSCKNKPWSWSEFSVFFVLVGVELSSQILSLAHLLNVQ